MSSNSQIIGGRRVSVPVREREQDAFRYFRVDSAALNVARPDGKRISFVKGWYKTKNVGDISYLLELIDEGQIGIWEHVEQSAEMDFTNTLSGSVAQLEQIEAQIAADPRFAAAIAQMVAATQGQGGSCRAAGAGSKRCAGEQDFALRDLRSGAQGHGQLPGSGRRREHFAVRGREGGSCNCNQDRIRRRARQHAGSYEVTY
jgi:hypothetical protein